jgi:hypothetical protein
MKTNILFVLFVLPTLTFAQSDLDKVLKAGEVLINGFSILKVGNSNPKKDSKTIESVCVKNKLTEKITVNVNGKSTDGEDVKKQLVIQKENKECFLEFPKGIFTYEILLSNNEIYKKGEYKFDDNIVITIKKED